MFDQVFDNFRKVTESTMQMQQDMFRQWIGQWPSAPAMPSMPSAAGLTEQAQSVQKKWLENVTAMMNKHREALDTQYKSGIRAIEDAFHVAEAKSPEEYRKLTEELWRKSFESLKSTAESQMRDFQSAIEKWFEIAAKAKG